MYIFLYDYKLKIFINKPHTCQRGIVNGTLLYLWLGIPGNSVLYRKHLASWMLVLHPLQVVTAMSASWWPWLSTERCYAVTLHKHRFVFLKTNLTIVGNTPQKKTLANMSYANSHSYTANNNFLAINTLCSSFLTYRHNAKL